MTSSNFTSNLETMSLRDESADEESMDLSFIIVGKRCKNNAALVRAVEKFQAPVVFSDTGFEHMQGAEDDTIFVLDNFEGNIFHKLHKGGCRIVGPPVIIQCAKDQTHLPGCVRPLYCLSMKRQVLCFTGFRVKDELLKLADLVHHMGGSIRKEFSSRVTHLVAHCTSGEKYRVAVSLGTPTMTDEWVYKAWEAKDDISISATDDILVQYKLSPFSFSVLSFMGFSKEERRDMERLAVDNGGSCAEAGSPACTHLVIDEHNVKQVPFETNHRLHIVKSEWFWASIQMDSCADESLYRAEGFYGTPSSRQSSRTTPTPKTLSGSKSRKRKRLRENIAQLAHEGEVDTPMYKRRSGSDAGRISFSASFLDATADTSGTPLQDHTPGSNFGLGSPHQTPVTTREPVKLTGRQQSIMELFQTEKNYVGILHTILKTFKEDIERTDQPGGPLLDAQDIRLIFGDITPIYDIHVKIRDELSDITSNFSDDRAIGPVFLKNAEALTKSYPNFVNYFERTKERIIICSKHKPRFHAFLKGRQTRPECGRQTLTELLIRPVQRLPSVMLIMKDILKRSDTGHPDREYLSQAISTLENVMTHINEDKRKAEGHQVMFDIVNDIENCPANLLSAHRTFITRVDAIEMTDELSGRGDPITLFVFSDSVELCKRRIKVLNSKSPAAHGAKTPVKAYKHLTVIQFSCVKRVVDLCETPDCKNAFALITKSHEEVTESLLAFALMDEMIRKEDFLIELSKTICTNMCRADYETLMTTVEPHTLNMDTSDIGTKTLSRAATRFGKRVSRAFSFNKTPRKLKRAMSSMTQMMGSPFGRRDSAVFANPNMITPGRRYGTNDLRAMRLASTNDLTDENMYNESTYSDLVDQMSIGTPTSRRRETLVGVEFVNIQQELNKNKSQDSRKVSKLKKTFSSFRDPDSPHRGLPRTPSQTSVLSTMSSISGFYK